MLSRFRDAVSQPAVRRFAYSMPGGFGRTCLFPKQAIPCHSAPGPGIETLSGSANIKASQLGASPAMAFEVLVVGDCQVPALVTEILPASNVSHLFELVSRDTVRATDRGHDITALNSTRRRLQACEKPRRQEPPERRGIKLYQRLDGAILEAVESLLPYSLREQSPGPLVVGHFEILL